MLEVGGEDGVASLGEFGELLRIAVGLAGGGALEQFGVFGGAQGGDFAGEVLQVFQSLALLLVFAGGLGEVENQAVEQQVAALRPLFGFGAGQSLEERLGAGLALQQLQFGDVPVDARQALFARGVLLLAGAPLFQGDGRFVGLQALGEFVLGCAEAFLGGGAGEGGEALGEQGFRVVAEDAVGQRMQGLPECRAGGIGPGVEGLEQGAGVFLEAAVLLARFAAWRMARSSRSARSRLRNSLSIFTCNCTSSQRSCSSRACRLARRAWAAARSASLSWASRLAWFSQRARALSRRCRSRSQVAMASSRVTILTTFGPLIGRPPLLPWDGFPR